MDTKQLFSTALDLKAVDAQGRTLEGYAAVFGNLDRTGDIIDAKAFDRTLAANPDVQVFVGHKADTLPVGEAFDLKPDGHGLFTRVKVYKTAAGDELLEVARQRMASGKSLGMSIGYRTVKERFDSKTKARHLLDVDLVEFSYLASPALAANPQAMVTAMKSNTAEVPSLEEMQRLLSASYDAMRELKATLDAAARDRLDDSDFAFVDSDGDGHLPIQDEGHVRAALSRFNQTHFPDPATKKRAARKVLAAARRHGIDVADDSAVAEAAKTWEDGGAAQVVGDLAERLTELKHSILSDQHAMDQLGMDLKGGNRLYAERRKALAEVREALDAILTVADAIEAGEDGRLRVDLYRHRLQLMELEEVA